jgi:hypothetical protein
MTLAELYEVAGGREPQRERSAAFGFARAVTDATTR